MEKTRNERLMRTAIEVCQKGIAAGQSPFGAVVATAGGEVVAAAHNQVRMSCDATAHAEVAAIRGACRALGTIDLAGHVIATTCEPCPMCAAAIHWANLDEVIYGAGIDDAAGGGFRELPLRCHQIYRSCGSNVKPTWGVLAKECRELFEQWKNGPNPKAY